MSFLAITSACNDPGLIPILVVVKRILSLLQIIGPILALVMMSINLAMLVKNPDDKKALPKVRNSAIALVVLFMVPVIVNAFFALLDDSTTLSSCWNSATSYSTNSQYVPIDSTSTPSTIYSDPSDYE